MARVGEDGKTGDGDWNEEGFEENIFLSMSFFARFDVSDTLPEQ